jgi:hypothetical protein
MTTAALADLLHARRVGRDKYVAHCPGPSHKRNDRTASLSIRAGRDGKVLLHCFAGCSATDIVSAAGLRVTDLFDGPAPSRAQLRQGAEEREKAEAHRHAMRAIHREGCRRLRDLQDFIESLAPRLMVMPDGDEADKLTRLYHETLDQIRYLESALVSIERCL